MCNIAGYVGDMRAAPVLIEMLKKQEGFAGGYYTGIATLDNGRIYHAKVIGDTAKLIQDTDAMELPGRVGIIHSRSNSGGDREWAHPFLDCDNNMAYIANGHIGYFNKQVNINKLTQQLIAEGHIFQSRTKEQIKGYPALQDNTSVHFSEIMCHLIESNVNKRMGPGEAMKRAYQQFPSEIVGLMIHTDTPDSIIASRISQPLMIGHSLKSTYLSTTALGFPMDTGIHTVSAMPVNATAMVYSNLIKIIPFNPPPGKVSMIIPWNIGFEKIRSLLIETKGNENGERLLGLGSLKRVTESIWPKHEVSQKDMMVYEILRCLYEQGEIDFIDKIVNGILPNSKKTQKTVHYLSKN